MATVTIAENAAQTSAPTADGAVAVRPLRRIGVWGHYHGGNQGDDLVVATVIANLRARWPEADIIGFCLNPADTLARHGIRAFPINQHAGRSRTPTAAWKAARETTSGGSGWWSGTWNWLKQSRVLQALKASFRTGWTRVQNGLRELPFIWRSYQALRGVDLLVVAGSAPLFDGWGGPWGHPYAVFKWSLLAYLRGARVVYLSIGAGPLDAGLSRFFVSRAVRLAEYSSFRDVGSANLIKELGVRGAPLVCPDMGFAFPAEKHINRPAPACLQKRPVVGLNVMAHLDPRHMPWGDGQKYSAYLRRMAAFAHWLLQQDIGVVMLYSQIQADPRATAEMLEILCQEHGLPAAAALVAEPIHDFADLATQISWCDLVVSARFHCLVVPLAMGKPVVALAYHPKTVDLMESISQGAYCLDIDTASVEEIVRTFQALQAAQLSVGQTIREHVGEFRRQLAAQFDQAIGIGPQAD